MSTIARHLDRLPAILTRVGAELVELRPWGGLWLATAVCALLAGVRVLREGITAALPSLLVLAWIAAGIALAVGAFMTTGWKLGSYEKLMEVTLVRLLMHHAPLTLLCVTMLCTRAPNTGASSQPVASR
jgi:hypothetical protein